MDSELRRITDRVRAALTHGTALRIRAGGSKDFYGQSLQGEVLDVSAWRGIVSYEPSELVVTVRAGTTLQELQTALAEKGQHLAFEPPCFGRDAADVSAATCGGMVAAGLSGPARASAGAVREFVGQGTLFSGIEMIFPTLSGIQILPESYPGFLIAMLPPGAFFVLGLLIAGRNWLDARANQRVREHRQHDQSPPASVPA